MLSSEFSAERFWANTGQDVKVFATLPAFHLSACRILKDRRRGGGELNWWLAFSAEERYSSEGIEVVLKFYSRSLHCPACLLFMAAGGEGVVKYEARWLIAKSPPKISFKRMLQRGQYYMIRRQLVWGSVQLMQTIHSQDDWILHFFVHSCQWYGSGCVRGQCQRWLAGIIYGCG